MEKDKQPPVDIDIVDEKYAGPSAHIAALGTGVIKHLKWAIIGIGGGFIYAMFDRKGAASVIKYFREKGTALKVPIAESDGFFAKAQDEIRYTWGGAYHLLFGDKDMADALRGACNISDPKKEEWIKNAAMSKEQGFGYFFITHAAGIIPGLGKWVKNEFRAAAEKSKNAVGFNALTFGGAFGAGGYISGWVTALILGAQHGGRGKHQFERAKDKIQSLQEDNSDLTRINEELRQKYIKAATRLDTVAREEASHVDTARSDAPVAADAALMLQTAAPDTAVQLDQHQHEGRLAQQELAVA